MRLVIRDINGNTLGIKEGLDITGEIYEVTARLVSSETIIVTVDYNPDPDTDY